MGSPVHLSADTRHRAVTIPRYGDGARIGMKLTFSGGRIRDHQAPVEVNEAAS
jgi:hypothetical protein